LSKKSKYERIDIVNNLIRKIANTGRRFFYYGEENRYSYFVYDGRTLYYVDRYRGVPLKMVKGNQYRNLKQKRYFSEGGTLWGLVNDFKDYIYGDDDSNHNNGYGGLYSTSWGYKPNEMDEIRNFAKELGYLES